MKNKKIALLFICLNPPYWPYVKDVIEDCDKYFLTNRKNNHKVDYFLWSDIKDETFGATVFPTDGAPWPAPTLMRYHLFLQQEEILKDYDYIFYMDADMRVVSSIDDEILGESLTMAEHPMYALQPKYVPPYEPNKESAAFVNRLGIVTSNPQNGNPWLKPLYAAGGFQGGKSEDFIKAMKVMKKNIDKDFNKNYSAVWNDESHWNRYLSDNCNPLHGGKLTVLTPSYVYPDSLINEYYIPLWGKNYQPKIVTLTKPFSLSKEGGEGVQKMINAEVPTENTLTCSTCGDHLNFKGHYLKRVVSCKGKGQLHEIESVKI